MAHPEASDPLEQFELRFRRACAPRRRRVGHRELRAVERLGADIRAVEVEPRGGGAEALRQHVGIGAGAGLALAEAAVGRAPPRASRAPGPGRARRGRGSGRGATPRTCRRSRAAGAAARSRRGVAPAAAQVARMRSSSASFMPGIIGAASTPAGMPARASSAMAATRREGVAARGSMRRARFASSVVTDRQTCTRLRAARRRRMSRSRSTPADLVTMVTGWPKRSSTSSTRAGELQGALHRLVGVGVGAQRHRPRDVAGLAELLLQQRRQVRLE